MSRPEKSLQFFGTASESTIIMLSLLKHHDDLGIVVLCLPGKDSQLSLLATFVTLNLS